MIKSRDMIAGAICYTVGDTIAACITDEFSWLRFSGMIVIGGLLYAFEVPLYFNWINKKTAVYSGLKASVIRMLMAIAFFNPIWIARHTLFIKVLLLQFDQIKIEILHGALLSFIFNIPISLTGNYIIQNIVKEKYRFLANAIFSGVIAVYYALSVRWLS